MSRLITILCIIVIMLGISIYGIVYVKETNDTMKVEIEKAYEFCNNNNTTQLIETSKDLSEYFHSRQAFLSLYVRHDEIEKINFQLVDLASYSNMNSKEDVIVKLDQLKFMVNHIYERELPNLNNVL